MNADTPAGTRGRDSALPSGASGLDMRPQGHTRSPPKASTCGNQYTMTKDGTTE